MNANMLGTASLALLVAVVGIMTLAIPSMRDWIGDANNGAHVGPSKAFHVPRVDFKDVEVLPNEIRRHLQVIKHHPGILVTLWVRGMIFICCKRLYHRTQTGRLS